MERALTKLDLHNALVKAKSRCHSSADWDALEHIRILVAHTYAGVDHRRILTDPRQEKAPGDEAEGQ